MDFLDPEDLHREEKDFHDTRRAVWILLVLLAGGVCFFMIATSNMASAVTVTKALGLIVMVTLIGILIHERAHAINNGDVTEMICPHCQTKGTVTTTHVRRKVGISGTKATAAIFTWGISLLATGLSRKETATEAHCSKCGATWRF